MKDTFSYARQKTKNAIAKPHLHCQHNCSCGKKTELHKRDTRKLASQHRQTLITSNYCAAKIYFAPMTKSASKAVVYILSPIILAFKTKMPDSGTRMHYKIEDTSFRKRQ